MKVLHMFVPLMLVALLGACAENAGVVPVETLDPDLALAEEGGTARYEIAHLGSLGGASQGHVINPRGWVAGFSERDDHVRRAALWRDGELIDLGSLGADDSNSNVPWAGLNNNGMVVGISETGEADDLGQAWSCASFVPVGTPTGRTCVGFVWDGGEMKALPGLGGANSFATGVNNRGQVVGWAETAVHDPTCTAPQVRQFRAVLWEPRKGRMHELPPLPGDSTSAATAINESGRAVGISGDCDVAVGRHSARHAVVWDRGRVERLPTLGGEAWHTPMSVNDRGEIVGFSLGTDPATLRAVLWSRTGEIEELGTLQDDPSSQALAINARGQVVGTSYGGADGLRAFIWQDGVITDLNDLALATYEGTLLQARHIDDRGVITGVADDGDGNIVTFVATPVR